jgi:cytochrome c biogenesis protein CcmG, thiol:disulfide interchange protein DsbE
MRDRDDQWAERDEVWGGDDFVDERATRGRTRGLIVLIPLLVFIGLALLFAFSLNSGDPSKIPSPLIGKPAPQTDLPPVPGLRDGDVQLPGFNRANLSSGRVHVVNVWASWCAPCRLEHEYLMQLRDLRPGAALYGINYKDTPEAAARFIRQLGNPFDAVGEDQRGRAGVEWGVTGVPETFIVDGDGIIIHKITGQITAENLRDELLPAIDGADPSARQARVDG